MNENQKISDPRPLPAGSKAHEQAGGKAIIKAMIIMLILAGLVFGGIFGFKLYTARMIKKFMSANIQPAVTISETKAAYQTWQPRLEAVGTTRAVRGVDVTTEISGLVTSLDFESGEKVKKNQVLVRLNAEADLAQLHSLQAQADLARTNLKRQKQQFAIKAISQSTLDIAA